MRSVVIALVATLAHPAILVAAPPELALGELQLQLEPRRDYLADDEATAVAEWVRFAGFAQLTGGGRAGGDVGAGAAVAVGGIGCDLVAASVHGRFRPLAEDGEPFGRVTYSLCPFAALMTLKFDGRRGTGLMPALDARRSLWNRAYTDVYDQMTIAFGPYWKNDGDPFHSIFVFSLGHGTTTQSDDFETRTTKTLDVSFVAYQFEHRGFGLDVVGFTGTGLKAGEDNKGGVASHFVPLRLRYESPLFYARGEAGWGWTGGQITASGKTEVDGETVSEWRETIDSEGLPAIRDWTGELEAGVRGARVQASGRVSRAFFPTFDGNVARESRVTGTLAWTPGRKTQLSIAPFATRTRTWEREAPSSVEIGAGAQLHVGREINRKLRVDAIGEAGVSPYARSESDRLPTPRLGGQFLLALSGRVTDLQR